MKLLILGAGGHGRAVAGVTEAMGGYTQIAFLDDSGAPGSIGSLADCEKWYPEFDCAFAAFGNPALRKYWQEKLQSIGYQLPVLVHPAAFVSPDAKLGAGTVVMPGAVVQCNVQCGTGCILSAGAIIDHDATLEDFCHINAGAIVPSMAVVETGTKVDYGRVYRKSESGK